MAFPPKSGLWHVGFVPAPIATLTSAAAVREFRERVAWFPDPGRWRYLADPFAVRRDGALHAFVEAYDYRTKHAVIEHHEFGPDLRWRRGSTCLRADVHLSYPFLVEHDGETFMVPESHQAREVVLYRARRFPEEWVREAVLLADVPASDATLLRDGDRWWMFHVVAGPESADRRRLYAAHAPALTGPWTPYRGGALVDDLSGARPGGTPFRGPDGAWWLPVQDCSGSYGGALRFLRITSLTPDEVTVERAGDRLDGALLSTTHVDGLHTLSACGDVTLFDAKRVVRSFGRYAVDVERFVRRLVRPG
jgi:hypothetical protein